MSIPPLVCSTPPPPDQCEEDKDPEDFDLSYSLSQEDEDDDDNGYNYGNFSTYNHFQSSSDNKPLDIKELEITKKNIEGEVHKEIFLKCEKESKEDVASETVFRTNDINENKIKCEEDTNIEDLNLKVDEEIDNIEEISNKEPVSNNDPNISSYNKDLDIPCNSNNDADSSEVVNTMSYDGSQIEPIETIKEINSDFVTVEEDISEVIAEDEQDINITVMQENVAVPTVEENEPLPEPMPILDDTQTLDQFPRDLDIKLEENELDDDFGDFDDFQTVKVTTSNVTDIVASSNNPWENDEPKESDFGNFKANFEENSFQTADTLTSMETEAVKTKHTGDSQTEDVDNNAEDDDFGDFDDFKSSATKIESNDYIIDDSSQCHDLPVLNWQLSENEHQIMESITKVLSSVFIEEIPEPESEFEGTLESLLSETWGHLMETDERQPYIVNWNNSLGQKTLLKSLCIDSRNILFGPKWSSNMPKYAANLSNAPLQPQKQASVPSSIVTQSEIVADKPTSKPTTWTDPFTSDGQESCNTENESASITPGPTDLDVFEATVSTKPDKIYSNTMSVQPLRQINLPDTHIFTPTDSEIPRSKTIHYDSPTVILPQPSMEENKNQTDVNIPTANSVIAENNIEDSEYWEFQNFKSTSDILPGSTSSHKQVTSQEHNVETATTVNALPKPNIAYQTELLQPIKVEPAMPTLNWPDPGEVKEVFDDFSDFVSISSQPNEQQDTSSIPPEESQADTKNINMSNHLNTHIETTEITTEIMKPDNDFDDDFDTFQSAVPSKSSSSTIKSSYLGNNASQVSSNQITEFDYGSPNFDSIKSDTISFPSVIRPNEALTQNLGYISNSGEYTNRQAVQSGSQMQTNVLQPTPASYSTPNTQSQQKSGQILQPLSLESYSQINWPSPGIDLQDLSRFNPVETLHSLKSDLSVSGLSKGSSPVHSTKATTAHQVTDDDVWGEFVSSKPKQQQTQPKKPSTFVDDDEWTDFISSPSVKPQNGLNTISLNVHTNSNIQKSVQSKLAKKSNQPPLDIPTLNYITPKSNPHKSYNDKHFQNL
ncbi:aftiphilin isoform X2 [Anticarsia gemmatalis]|uniref:aftiphilin isoform X2 n=1 Tax=Anticarsia gemmatalis TaxID=129554 RepID=UPI003F759579